MLVAQRPVICLPAAGSAELLVNRRGDEVHQLRERHQMAVDEGKDLNLPRGSHESPRYVVPALPVHQARHSEADHEGEEG